MKKITLTTVFALGLTLCGALPALAQGPPHPPPGGDWTELMGKIATVRLVKLAEALALSDETALKLNRYLKEYDGKRADVMRRRGELHREIKAYMESGEDDDALAAELLEEGIAIETESHELNVEIIQGTGDILTPAQQLKFVVVSREFEREVMEMVRDRRGRGHGGPPGE